MLRGKAMAGEAKGIQFYSGHRNIIKDICAAGIVRKQEEEVKDSFYWCYKHPTTISIKLLTTVFNIYFA
jgi:hypothetical protein